MPLVLCDTMGLEEKSDAGLDIEDLVNIFEGHVEDRYQVSYFNPSSHVFHDDSLSLIHRVCACLSV